jgi:CRISPR-associated protein Csd1
MILQALNGYYDRVAGYSSTTPKFGYGFAPISFALVLRPDGSIADVNDLREKDGNRMRPTELLVPKDFEDRTSGDSAPRAFWDKIEYVFGVSDMRNGRPKVQEPERGMRRS